eukprot:364282-Chlamydomonas_euryale.AAC.50
MKLPVWEERGAAVPGVVRPTLQRVQMWPAVLSAFRGEACGAGVAYWLMRPHAVLAEGPPPLQCPRRPPLPAARRRPRSAAAAAAPRQQMRCRPCAGPPCLAACSCRAEVARWPQCRLGALPLPLRLLLLSPPHLPRRPHCGPVDATHPPSHWPPTGLQAPASSSTPARCCPGPAHVRCPRAPPPAQPHG